MADWMIEPFGKAFDRSASSCGKRSLDDFICTRDSAVAFYVKCGFDRLLDNPKQLCLLRTCEGAFELLVRDTIPPPIRLMDSNFGVSIAIMSMDHCHRMSRSVASVILSAAQNW